jgi:hypothetical protein
MNPSGLDNQAERKAIVLVPLSHVADEDATHGPTAKKAVHGPGRRSASAPLVQKFTTSKAECQAKKKRGAKALV